MQTHSKDYIEKLIEILANALAKMLGLKEKGKSQELVTVYNDNLKNFFELDINEVRTLSEDALLQKLFANRQLKSHHIEFFADMLKVYSEVISKTDKVLANSLYNKSIRVYNEVSIIDKAYNLQREKKIDEIKLLIT